MFCGLYFQIWEEEVGKKQNESALRMGSGLGWRMLGRNRGTERRSGTASMLSQPDRISVMFLPGGVGSDVGGRASDEFDARSLRFVMEVKTTVSIRY